MKRITNKYLKLSVEEVIRKRSELEEELRLIDELIDRLIGSKKTVKHEIIKRDKDVINTVKSMYDDPTLITETAAPFNFNQPNHQNINPVIDNKSGDFSMLVQPFDPSEEEKINTLESDISKRLKELKDLE